MTPQPAMIAHYRLTTKLGEGGMGAVYRATDTRLNRDVAIKVLPDAFASDPDRLARFTREAQVLAQLNHPNIAAIYGVEDRAIVMELVEGADLRGPLTPGEALPLIEQLIDALEYAHEKGIVHRDLKPANLKLTPDNRLKVLDFGLAKALSSDASLQSTDKAASPTLTMRATMAGVIMGTAAYMSPEQARGQLVDKRSDIWSFGVLVYELLTGKQLFDGGTVSDTLAAVLRQDLDLAQVPPRFQKLLSKCLTRDPRQRLRDISGARLLLEEEPVPTPAPPAPNRAIHWPYLIAIAVFALAALALALVHFREAAPPAPVMRFTIPPPENAHWSAWLALSPDGRYLGFTALAADNKNRIWIRALDSFDSRMLAGTENVNTFFWSPDSRWVAFLTGGKLKKVEISGGPPQTICNFAGTGLGGTWNSQDVILFGSTASSIMRVPASGGEPVPVTALAAARDVMHVYPVFLSDGDHFLYMHRTRDRVSGIFVGSLKTKPSDQELKPVQASALDVSFGYSPPRPRNSKLGHLLFLHEGTLMAQTFDEKSLAVRGEPVPVAESISTNLSRSAFSVSSAGMLAYRTGSSGTDTRYVWFDRQGHESGEAGRPGELRRDVGLSPDNLRLAHTIGHAPGQIAVLDLARGIDTRLTFNTDGAANPAWSADGKWIAFGSSLFGGTTIYVKDAGNNAPERKILQSATIKYMNDWSRDGRFLVYTQFHLTLGFQELWALADPLGSGEHKPIALTDARFREAMASFSPDSRWLAYDSEESRDVGADEIYVRPFPPGDGRTGRWRVSSAGGTRPRWRADGKELFYIDGDRRLMAVDVTTGPGAAVFQSGVPQALFTTNLPLSEPSFGYDVAKDGKRFLMSVPSASPVSTPVTLVLNWESGLKK